MSEVFAKQKQRLGPAPNQETISTLLAENTQLIATITENYNKGRMQEVIELQKLLHRNLVYLSCLAYPSQPSGSQENQINEERSNEDQVNK